MLKDVIVDYIHQFISDYFEPPDGSQLTLSLWAGNVVLHDLVIKTEAIESNLGLPINVTAGKVGKVGIKIPWASLFTSSVEVILEDLYALLTPSYTVYDKEAEERISSIVKKNVIQKLEDGYKEYLIRTSGEHHTHESTYIEKIALQIARNVQIKIESIHLRYEDKVINPTQPFSIGVVLKSLVVQATDDKWIPTFVSNCSNAHYQLGKMEGLALYWNINSDLIIDAPEAAGIQAAYSASRKKENPNDLMFIHAISQMKAMLIADDTQDIKSLKYIIGPIKAEAKMTISPCQGQENKDFTLPHFSTQIVIQELALGISQSQVWDLMRLAETIEFIARNQRFKKYKSGDLLVSTRTRNNYKEWWKFAYDCVLEDVHRRHTNWSWAHMSQHRQTLKSYIDAYYKKITEKNPTPALENEVAELEKSLDIFNIILARKIVRVKRIRLQKFEAARSRQPSWSSYIMSWFVNPNPNLTTLTEIGSVLLASWTSEEKAQLRDAVHLYQQNVVPEINYPPDYESLRIHFQINKMTFVLSAMIPTLEDKANVILHLEIIEFDTKLAHRPVKNGGKFELSLGSIEARGISDKPYIALSKKFTPPSNLLKLVVENHPIKLNSFGVIVDKKISLVAHQIQLIYHWKTFQKLVDVFSFQSRIELSELNAAATSTMHKLKEMSQSKFDHLMEDHAEMEVVVDFAAPYILVPQNGELKRINNILVIDLGKLRVRNLAKETKQPDSYPSVSIDTTDTYDIELNNFQVFLVLHGENYGYKSMKRSNYLLKCSQTKLSVKHSMMARLNRTHPTLQIDADIPLIDLGVTQKRITQLINLIITLPLPHPKISLEHKPSEYILLAESKALLNLPSLVLDASASGLELSPEFYLRGDNNSIKESKEKVDVAHHAIIHSVYIVRVKCIKVKVNPDTEKLLVLELLQFEATFRERTYDKEIDIELGGITLSILGHNTLGKLGPLYLINSPYRSATKTPLLKFEMLTVEPVCPKKFLPPFPLTMMISVSTLNLIFHQEAVSTLLRFIEECLTESISNPLEIQSAPKNSNIVSQSSPKISTNMRVEAHVKILTIILSTNDKKIAKFFMENLHGTFEDTSSTQTLLIRISKIEAYPMDSKSPYQKILFVEGDKVFDGSITSVVTNPLQPTTPDKYDLNIRITTGSISIFLLPSFIGDISKYVNHFGQMSESYKNQSPENLNVSTEKSDQNLKTVANSDTSRVSISLQAEAPRIAFLKDDFSPEAILIDLGRLSLKNELKANSQQTPGQDYLCDEINFIFTEASISRVCVNFDTQNIMAQVFVLNPFSCKCNIRRNIMSTDSMTPYLHIHVDLPENKIKVDTEDFRILKHALDEISKAMGSSDANSAPGNTDLAAKQDSNQDNPPETTVDNALILSIELNLDLLNVVLYNGITLLTDKSGTVQRDELQSLATLSLQHFKGSCKFFRNLGIEANLTVGDITIQDDRSETPQSSKSIFQRDQSTRSPTQTSSKGEHELNDDPFFTISYQNGARNSKQNKFRMKLSSLSCDMSAEFLLEVLKFFN